MQISFRTILKTCSLIIVNRGGTQSVLWYIMIQSVEVFYQSIGTRMVPMWYWGAHISFLHRRHLNSKLTWFLTVQPFLSLWRLIPPLRSDNHLILIKYSLDWFKTSLVKFFLCISPKLTTNTLSTSHLLPTLKDEVYCSLKPQHWHTDVYDGRVNWLLN